MKRLTLLAFIAVTIFTSCGSSVPKEESRPKTPEELRAELKQQESDNPLEYLTDKVSIKPNRVLVKEEGLFTSAEYADDGSLIEGTITNKATLAKFKDVKVKVTYFSATETEISSEDFVFYEYYKPNSSNTVSLKVYPPDAFKTFGFEITGATPVYE